MRLQGQATFVVVTCSPQNSPLHPLLFWRLGESGWLVHVMAFLLNFVVLPMSSRHFSLESFPFLAMHRFCIHQSYTWSLQLIDVFFSVVMFKWLCGPTTWYVLNGCFEVMLSQTSSYCKPFWRIPKPGCFHIEPSNLHCYSIRSLHLQQWGRMNSSLDSLDSITLCRSVILFPNFL